MNVILISLYCLFAFGSHETCGAPVTTEVTSVIENVQNLFEIEGDNKIKLADEASPMKSFTDNFSVVSIFGKARQHKSSLMGLLAANNPQLFKASTCLTDHCTNNAQMYMTPITTQQKRSLLYIDSEGINGEGNARDKFITFAPLVLSEVTIINLAAVPFSKNEAGALLTQLTNLVEAVQGKKTKLGHLHVVYQKLRHGQRFLTDKTSIELQLGLLSKEKLNEMLEHADNKKNDRLNLLQEDDPKIKKEMQEIYEKHELGDVDGFQENNIATYIEEDYKKQVQRIKNGLENEKYWNKLSKFFKSVNAHYLPCLKNLIGEGRSLKTDDLAKTYNEESKENLKLLYLDNLNEIRESITKQVNNKPVKYTGTSFLSSLQQVFEKMNDNLESFTVSLDDFLLVAKRNAADAIIKKTLTEYNAKKKVLTEALEKEDIGMNEMQKKVEGFKKDCLDVLKERSSKEFEALFYEDEDNCDATIKDLKVVSLANLNRILSLEEVETMVLKKKHEFNSAEENDKSEEWHLIKKWFTERQMPTPVIQAIYKQNLNTRNKVYTNLFENSVNAQAIRKKIKSELNDVDKEEFQRFLETHQKACRNFSTSKLTEVERRKRDEEKIKFDKLIKKTEEAKAEIKETVSTGKEK
eukprot:Pgem_evm1s9054